MSPEVRVQEASGEKTVTEATLNRLFQEGAQAYQAADYRTALEKWQEGLNQARTLGNKQYSSQLLMNIGAVYWYLGQYEQALASLEQASLIFRELGDRQGEGRILNNIGLVYQNLRSQFYRAFSRGELIELPETAEEAETIAEHLNAPEKSEPLQLRENASRTKVFEFNSRERLDDYQYLLFAMHGVLPGEVSQVTQSALVLSDDFLTMADVFSLHLNAKLVSLSACNTGMGAQVKGEGVIGLTRAFMYAGTPAVAVTLWSVESLSAKDLDIGFFRYLEDGMPPARALQTVKLEMLYGEYNESYRSPYYWAPFVVFGDGW